MDTVDGLPGTNSPLAPTGDLAMLRSSLVDRYAIKRELGRGGMAVVYLADDLRHKREVAIKVLRSELAAAVGVERFLQEIHIEATLQHPHILPLHDSGNAGGLPYYVMPYVAGETLRSRLEREKQLAVPDVLRIASEVADALCYAHGKGLVHRDIKPENILLAGEHALVSDFGIARAVAVAGAERITSTGISVGTPAYMSPEQGAGSERVDGRSDVYSLGCVVYEMLAGEPPYTGRTARPSSRGTCRIVRPRYRWCARVCRRERSKPSSGPWQRSRPTAFRPHPPSPTRSGRVPTKPRTRLLARRSERQRRRRSCWWWRRSCLRWDGGCSSSPPGTRPEQGRRLSPA